MNRYVLLITVVPLLLFTVVFASGEAQMSNNNEYNKLSWLVGKWEGEAFGGICQEIWEADAGGTMTGTFKLISGDKVSFYEFMVIDLNLEQPALILKHFNADMTGWEEKDTVITFPILTFDSNKIAFEGMSYENITGDSLKITIAIKHPDGKAEETIIKCRRVE